MHQEQPDIPGWEIIGKIEFVSPEITPNTRINLVRVSMDSPGKQLRPLMPAYFFIKQRHHTMHSLSSDAVIRNGKVATIWIQTGPYTFKNRMISVGIEIDDKIEIRLGIQPGDRGQQKAILVWHSYFRNGAR